MQTNTITPAFIEAYLAGFAERFADAPGAAHLSELTATVQGIPELLLSRLTAQMTALDPRAVSSTLAVRAREVAIDGLRYDDATDFVRALGSELQGFLDEPEVMVEALAELERRERGSVH